MLHESEKVRIACWAVHMDGSCQWQAVAEAYLATGTGPNQSTTRFGHEQHCSANANSYDWEVWDEAVKVKATDQASSHHYSQTADHMEASLILVLEKSE